MVRFQVFFNREHLEHIVRRKYGAISAEVLTSIAYSIVTLRCSFTCFASLYLQHAKATTAITNKESTRAIPGMGTTLLP